MKISPKLRTSPVTCGPVIITDLDERLSVCLVGEPPDKMKKYAMLLCMDLDRLFFITVNPPPDTIVDLQDGFGPSALTCLTLQQQWKWILDKFRDNQIFNLVSLYKWFTEVVIVPERTAAGLIHFHLIARLRDNKIDSDIPRFFWNLFDINLTKSGNAAALKRFIETTKAMVNYKVVTDSQIVEYLFNKDKKDYETIMNIKIYDDYPFQPLRLFYTDVE